MLVLEDFKDLSEEQVKEHIVKYYCDQAQYSEEDSSWCDEEPLAEHLKEQLESQNYIREQLKDCEVLVAYECNDGSYSALSLFIFRQGNKFYYMSGSHCSCNGFEGQFQLNEVSLIYLQSEHFSCESRSEYYNEEDSPNLFVRQKLVKSYLAELCPACGKHIPNNEERLVHLDWEMEQNKYVPEVN